MGADQSVDRVDLQHAQALQHAFDGEQGWWCFWKLAEALGRQCQAAGLVDGQLEGQA
ncbi:hypothetical protein D9M71_785430 [compost metagenome]